MRDFRSIPLRVLAKLLCNDCVASLAWSTSSPEQNLCPECKKKIEVLKSQERPADE